MMRATSASAYLGVHGGGYLNQTIPIKRDRETAQPDGAPCQEYKEAP